MHKIKVKKNLLVIAVVGIMMLTIISIHDLQISDLEITPVKATTNFPVIFDDPTDINQVADDHTSISLALENLDWDDSKDQEELVFYAQRNSVALGYGTNHYSPLSFTTLSFVPFEYQKDQFDNDRQFVFALTYRDHIFAGGDPSNEGLGYLGYQHPPSSPAGLGGEVFPRYIDEMAFEMELKNVNAGGSEFEILGATSTIYNAIFEASVYPNTAENWNNLVDDSCFEDATSPWLYNTPGSASHTIETEYHYNDGDYSDGATKVLTLSNPAGNSDVYAYQPKKDILSTHRLTIYFEGRRSGGTGNDVGLKVLLKLKDGLREEELLFSPSELQLTPEDTEWGEHHYTICTDSDEFSYYAGMNIISVQVFLYNNELCDATFDDIYIGPDYWNTQADPANTEIVDNLEDWKAQEALHNEYVEGIEDINHGIEFVAESMHALGLIAEAIALGGTVFTPVCPYLAGAVGAMHVVGPVLNIGSFLLGHVELHAGEIPQWIHPPDDHISDVIEYKTGGYGQPSPVLVETTFLVSVDIDRLDFTNDVIFSFSFGSTYVAPANLPEMQGADLSMDIHLTTDLWEPLTDSFSDDFNDGIENYWGQNYPTGTDDWQWVTANGRAVPKMKSTCDNYASTYLEVIKHESDQFDISVDIYKYASSTSTALYLRLLDNSGNFMAYGGVYDPWASSAYKERAVVFDDQGNSHLWQTGSYLYSNFQKTVRIRRDSTDTIHVSIGGVERMSYTNSKPLGYIQLYMYDKWAYSYDTELRDRTDRHWFDNFHCQCYEISGSFIMGSTQTDVDPMGLDVVKVETEFEVSSTATYYVKIEYQRNSGPFQLYYYDSNTYYAGINELSNKFIYGFYSGDKVTIRWTLYAADGVTELDQVTAYCYTY